MLGQVTQIQDKFSKLQENLNMEYVENKELMFSRHRSLPKTEEITYELTKDPALLHQYYVLRSASLANVLPVRMPIEPCEYDKRSDVIIVRSGKQVIGGARIIPRYTPQDKPVFVERGGFNLSQHLPELELDKHPYCDISKLFLLEEYQNDVVTRGLYQTIVNHFNKLGMRYGFATSSLATARIHRRSLRSTGANYQLIRHIEIPYGTPGREDSPANDVLNLFDTMPVSPAEKEKLLKTIDNKRNKRQNESVLA